MPDNDPIQRRLMDPRTMSFGEHLEELRRRLIFALLGIAPLFVISLVFGGWLLDFLIAPAQQQLRAAGLADRMQVTGLLEIISAYLRIALVVTIMVGLPWVVWQAWLFVAPGLYEHERRFAKLILPFSLVLSLLGIAFLYFVMLPAMLLFLIRFGADLGRPDIAAAPPPPGVVLPLGPPALDADPVEPPPGSVWYNRTLQEFRYAIPSPDGTSVIEIRGAPMSRTSGIAQQYRVSEYINLVFFMGLAFAIGFQTPVVVLLAGWLGLVDRRWLVKNRKYAVFVCAVAAAFLTPSPDPFSMVMLAAPLYLLYELGLFLLRFLPASRVARGVSWAGREPPGAGDA